MLFKERIRMESEKKPKRPRIGTNINSQATDNTEASARYEKVNYQEGYNPADRQQRPRYGSERQYQPRSYNNYRQERYDNRNSYGNQYGYSQNQHNRYQQEIAGENASSIESGEQIQENGYTPRQNYQPQRGYNNRGGYNNNRQGGYNNYNQNGYNNRGGYNNNRQGGYNNYNQNGYNNQGGYNNNRQGGYNNYNQNGYSNKGGYSNQRQQNNQYGNPRYQQQQRRNNNRGYNPQGMKFTPRPKQIDYILNDVDPNEEIRLNKYMANAGVCSRREADEHIAAGLVKVNGEVVTELGTKISRNDVVEYNDKVVTPERKCYVLLNKPKDCVTTSDDPNGRTTVLDLVKNACQERIYPVGRLDRNTTGVLLLTNDGDLASKLTHPKFVKKKIYHVWTDKDISEEDMQRIADGIELEDGEIHADEISYVTDKDRNQAGIEIHSGRNRIVRRIFEALGYRVTKLDRVYFAGLTKKNLPRGRWRYLTQEEVNYLRQGSFE